MTEIIGPVVCRPHARWAVCCYPVQYLPACSFQNDQTIAKLFATSLPDLALVLFCFQINSLKTQSPKVKVKAFFSDEMSPSISEFYYITVKLL